MDNLRHIIHKEKPENEAGEVADDQLVRKDDLLTWLSVKTTPKSVKRSLTVAFAQIGLSSKSWAVAAVSW